MAVLFSDGTKAEHPLEILRQPLGGDHRGQLPGRDFPQQSVEVPGESLRHVADDLHERGQRRDLVLPGPHEPLGECVHVLEVRQELPFRPVPQAGDRILRADGGQQVVFQ